MNNSLFFGYDLLDLNEDENKYDKIIYSSLKGDFDESPRDYSFYWAICGKTTLLFI